MVGEMDGLEDPLYAMMLKCQVMCTNYTYIAQSSAGLITITKVVSITTAADGMIAPFGRK